MPKIYKYTSVESAISIIKKKSVLLNNPVNFNDPYDCSYSFEPRDKKKTDKLLRNYATMKILMSASSKTPDKLSGFSKFLIGFLSKMISLTKLALLKYPFYNGIPLFGFILEKY